MARAHATTEKPVGGSPSGFHKFVSLDSIEPEDEDDEDDDEEDDEDDEEDDDED